MDKTLLKNLFAELKNEHFDVFLTSSFIRKNSIAVIFSNSYIPLIYMEDDYVHIETPEIPLEYADDKHVTFPCKKYKIRKDGLCNFKKIIAYLYDITDAVNRERKYLQQRQC